MSERPGKRESGKEKEINKFKKKHSNLLQLVASCSNLL